MSQFPRVSVVILNWNGRKHLENFLPGVLASGYPNLEVVVADNGSADDSLAFLEQRFPTVKRVVLNRNYGFAGGYNRALAQVEADYYVVLNNDVEVEKGWVEPVIELLEANKQIAAVQPKIRSYFQKDHFEYAGACGGWIDRYGYAFARGRVFETCEADTGQYNDACPVFWASGAAFFVRAAAFHEAGGFDESFFAHQEEIDLCWRFQRMGYGVWVCPQSVVYHVGGGTLPAGNPNKVYLNFRNSLVMLYKNLPPGGRFWRIWVRLVLDGVASLRFLLAGKGLSFWAVARSHWYFFGRLLKRNIKRTGAYPPVTGEYAGSIVWAYFVKKKKNFTGIVRR